MNHGPFFLPVSYGDVEDIAIAITRHGEFYHSGIIYRKSDDSISLIELTMTGIQDRPVPPNPAFAWAVPNIHKTLRRNAAAFCERVAEKNPKVYYGFHYLPPELCVTDGSIKPASGTIGFTCATFVLALLFNVQVELLQHTTWQPRIEDEEWQKKLFFIITTRQHEWQIPKVVLDGNSAEIPCVRYRPEEVVFGALSLKPPIDFHDASQNGPHVLRWVEALLSLAFRRTSV